ncbi:MAG: transcriptional regulator [Chloroflexota bacterium]|jgi:DNA-binding MarR family transcriptional regulator
MNEAIRKLPEIDRNIHEPARLMIVATLSAVDEADFLYLLQSTGLTKGNLSSHLSRLEQVGYVSIEKTFVGKVTRTLCRLTDEGREALEAYRQQMKSVL